ncbi:MAG: hypothetical protein M3X11_20700 [Acidobacteriota bacterium]|nr:hypothetical protein [Acidobacteriota bacterium]
MWNENQQQRFDELRQRKLDGSLSEEEQRQLELLSEELDREDAAYLRPAFEHSCQRQQDLDAEIAQKEARNALLAELAERERELLQRAHEQLEALRREQEMLRREYEHAMGEPLHAV